MVVTGLTCTFFGSQSENKTTLPTDPGVLSSDPGAAQMYFQVGYQIKLPCYLPHDYFSLQGIYSILSMVLHLAKRQLK